MATTAERIADYHQHFDNPKSILYYDKRVPSRVSSAHSLTLDVFKEWDVTRDNWDGYKNGGYKIKDANPIAELIIDGEESWFVALSQKGDRYFAEAFITRIPNADKQGNHFGLHPIHIFEVDHSEIEAVESVIWMKSRIERYPAFEPLPIGKDVRPWQKKKITPNGKVNLRCIPVVDKMVPPIGLLESPITAWIHWDAYKDTDGGMWAKISAAGIQYWINQAVIGIGDAK